MVSIQWLMDGFRDNADRTFLVWKGRSFSYRWLLDRLDEWRARLDEVGICSGTVIALDGSYSPETVTAVLALIEKGAVIVPLTSASAVHREDFLRIAEAQGVFTFDGTDRALFTAQSQAPVHPLLKALAASGDPGLILFSSGSTGDHKAALHNLSRLLDKFRAPRPGLVMLAFLLFDHIGGINTLLHVLSSGGTLVAAEGYDPDRICSAIEAHRVELLPTSPTFLNLLLLSEAWRRHELSSLRKVTYGTEVMPEQTLARLREILPGVKFQQTYGLTEVGILRSRSRSSDSLWVEIGGNGFETKIQEGTLWIRAHSAMLGYLNAPSPFDEEGWLNTGDEVEVDGPYLRILGRRSDIINVGGLKVFPAEVESVLLGMPNVRDVAVRGESNPITGQVVVAVFNLEEPEDRGSLRKRTREYCRSRLPAYKIPARIETATENQYNWRFKKMRRPS
jgi:long-chain acyl-CoA synthetase